MNDKTCRTIRQIIELNSLEDILNTFSQQQVKTTEVTAQIESLRAEIPENLLRKHDHLRNRGKRSVAEFRNGVCTGCHMRVATGSVPALLQGSTAQACENCGRLLYVLVLPPSGEGNPAEGAKRIERKGNRPRKSAKVEQPEDQAVLAA